MANLNTSFILNKPDLGIEGPYGSGTTKEQVSQEFLHDLYGTRIKCTRCGGIPTFRVIPKSQHLNTAEMQKGVYICQHCINLSPFNPLEYGIRDISS